MSDFLGTGAEPSFPWRYLFREVGPRTTARKRREGLCKFWGCSNPIRHAGARDCNTCKSRLHRIKHALRYAFSQVRESARKRSIPFDLSFEEFTEFDRQTGYLKSKGREKESLTIDRIESDKGYSKGNIRALTWSDNCAKRVEGMTDPIEPIARAMALHGGKSWHAYKRQAVEILYQVEILQAQQEGGFEIPEENCPF